MTRARYDLAERGIPGWHASSADGSSSTSGYGSDLARVLPDLVDGAWIIDKEALFESPEFYRDVVRAPLHGPSQRGGFLDALRQAPIMTVVVENFGLAVPVIDQIAAEREGREYGPMDSAPAEYLASYWRARGASISRYRGGEILPEGAD